MYLAKTTIERIQQCLKSKNITQKQMCADLDIGEDTIKRMTDKKGIGSFTLAKIADYLGVSVDYLLDREPIRSNISEPLDNIYPVPVFDSVSAGLGAYTDSHIVRYAPILITNPYDVENTICVTVQGDSMSPKIEDGDVIVVRKNCPVDDGDIAVVRIGDEAVVKKVMMGRGFITLISLNPAYEPRTITGPDLDEVEIVGRVLGTYTEF